MIRIASFDIGKKNFAFYTEDCTAKLMLSLEKYYSSLPKKFQRKVKGFMNEKIEGILQKIYKDGKRVSGGMGVFDIRENKSSNDLDMQTRMNMHKLLESYEWLWDTCDIILVEQQYFNISNGRKTKSSGANVDAIKLAECCVNWFLIKYGPFKDIIYFGAMYKTQTLGAPDKMTKSQRKKWSVEKGQKIFTSRKDQEAIDFLNSCKTSSGRKQKQDDVYDCVVMTQAYKFRKLVSNN